MFFLYIWMLLSVYRMRTYTLTLLGLLFMVLPSMAQDEKPVKTIKWVYIVTGGDTIPVFSLNPVHVFSPHKFKNNKERMEYTKLVRDVKKTYPYAKMIAASIIETYEYMETLPNKKEKQKHLEEVQEYIMERYKPEMKKMTRNQGKILIKLIDRQCRTSSYNIVKALLGDFKAGFYNVFAGLFGNSLKTRYDPEGKDRDIENIVIQIEEGSVDYYYSTSYLF